MAKHDASFLSQAQITHRIPGLVGVRLPDNVVLDFKVSTRIHVTMSLILITGHSKALCPTTGYTAKDWRLLPCVLRGALLICPLDNSEADMEDPAPLFARDHL